MSATEVRLHVVPVTAECCPAAKKNEIDLCELKRNDLRAMKYSKGQARYSKYKTIWVNGSLSPKL